MTKASMITIGCDLGDKYSQLCVLDRAGSCVETTRVRTTPKAFNAWFGKGSKACVAVETGTHTRWVTQLLEDLGHQVLVANARKLRLIYAGRNKSDRLDAQALARLARADPKLLNPVHLRGAQAQADLAILKARDRVVETRTKLINCVQGMLKSVGKRIRTGYAGTFHKRAREQMTEELRPALTGLLELIETLTEQIRRYEKQIHAQAQHNDDARVLMQIPGVGPLTSMAFVLTIEDPSRFRRSRDVGPFLGLIPRQWQSGNKDLELGITKAGDPYLRRLLVQCAHYILGPFGQDSDLRRFGMGIIERSGKTPRRGKKRTSPKKRAAVAVARKLAVLMHRLWVTGEQYQSLGYAENRTVGEQKTQASLQGR